VDGSILLSMVYVCVHVCVQEFTTTRVYSSHMVSSIMSSWQYDMQSLVNMFNMCTYTHTHTHAHTHHIV